jgi:hypothetical protein
MPERQPNNLVRLQNTHLKLSCPSYLTRVQYVINHITSHHIAPHHTVLIIFRPNYSVVHDTTVFLCRAKEVTNGSSEYLVSPSKTICNLQGVTQSLC